MQTWLLWGGHCRLKIKLVGSGQAAQQGGSSGKGGNKDGDRWMAECADCGEEGDLLCCEVLQPAGCCMPDVLVSCPRRSSVATEHLVTSHPV